MGKSKAKGHWDCRGKQRVWVPAPLAQKRQRGETAARRKQQKVGSSARARERQALAVTAAVGGLLEHLALHNLPATWQAAADAPWKDVPAAVRGMTLANQVSMRVLCQCAWVCRRAGWLSVAGVCVCM
jgi:hypothetical protein